MTHLWHVTRVVLMVIGALSVTTFLVCVVTLGVSAWRQKRWVRARAAERAQTEADRRAWDEIVARLSEDAQ